MSQTVITKNGILSVFNAGANGPQINITNFQIGSDLITPDSSMPGVISSGSSGVPVYTGVPSQLSYQIVDGNNVLFKIVLDETIGDFNIGNIGLFLSDGTMFSITALSGVTLKYKTNYPTIIGNQKTYNVITQLGSLSTAIDLTLITQDEAAIPVVATELVLPPPDLAPFPVYVVNEHTIYGLPALALRVNNTWTYVSTDPVDNYGTYVSSNYIDQTVLIGSTVAWSVPRNRFIPGNGNNPTIGVIGIRGLGNKILTLGSIYEDDSGPFTPGAIYYGGDHGSLITTPTQYPVGYALNANALFVTIGGGNNSDILIGQGSIFDTPVTIASNTATSNTNFLSLVPTDFGPNNPGLYIHKDAVANNWDIKISDGTIPGSLNLDVFNVTAPTPDYNDISNSVATTEFVNARVLSLGSNILAGTFEVSLSGDASGIGVLSASDPIANVDVVLKTVNSNPTTVGSSTSIPIVTVNEKGLVTSLSSVTVAAPITSNSPVFTGNPRAPTPTVTDNSMSIATTAFVQNFFASIDLNLSGYALLASPAFTGAPTAPTPTITDNSTTLATTAFVRNYVLNSGLSNSLYAPLNSPAFTGNPTAPTTASTDNSDSIATTSFVNSVGFITSSALSPYALLSSPNFSGTPTAPTVTATDNSDTIATTKFIKSLGYTTTTPVDLSPYALLNSPNFTGNPTAPTPTVTDNSTSVATTQFIQSQGYITVASLAPYALTNSPVFTGNPQAPTVTSTDNSTTIATTQFVQSLGFLTVASLAPYSLINSPVFTGNPQAPTPTLTDNSTSLATTQFIQGQGYITSAALSPYALLISPNFTGIPTAPTPTVTDSSTALATTQFIRNQGFITGNQTTVISGDVTGFGTTAIVVTLNSVNNNTATYGSSSTVPIITANDKGLVTSIDTAIITPAAIGAAPISSPNLTGNPTAPTLTSTDNSNSIATTSFVQSMGFLTGNETVSLTGDASGTGTVSVVVTLKTVNSDTATYGSSSVVPVITANEKGLVTSIGSATITPSAIGAAPLSSPNLTGNPTAPTPTSGDISNSIATTAFVVNEVTSNLLSAVVYKGTVDITATPPSTPATGNTWRVVTGGIPNSNYSFSTTVTVVDVGDYVVYNGSKWDRLPNTNPVISNGANIVVVPTGDTSYSVALAASPSFTGNPTAPTPTVTDNSTSLATTAFIHNQGFLTGNQVITLSGDASGSGTTSIAVTLNTVNSNTATYGSSSVVPVLTANEKGLVTSIGTATITPAAIGAAPISSPNLTGNPTAPTPTVTDNSTSLATTQFVRNQGFLTGNQVITVSGDASGSGTTSIAVTLPTVNNNTATYGSSSVVPVITANGKGLVTNIGTVTITPAAIGAAPLNSPALLGVPTAPTPTVTDNSTTLATTAFVNTLVNAAITSGVMYKGTRNVTAVAPPTSPNTGDMYRVTSTGAPYTGWSFSTTVTVVDIGDFVVYNGTNWDRIANTNPNISSGTNIVVVPTGDTSYSIALASSPVLTGNPTAPTVTSTDNSTSIATSAFVKSLGYITGNQSISLTGDASGSGTTSIAVTLPTVNSTTTAVGSSSVVPVLTANGKGLVTSIGSATITPVAIGAAPLNNANLTGNPTAPTVTSTDNSTSIATTQFVNTATAKYVQTFNATTDWGAVNGSGYYTISIAATTHNRGTYVIVQVFNGSTNFVVTLPDSTSVDSSGNVSVQVPGTPDNRFSGYLVIY